MTYVLLPVSIDSEVLLINAHVSSLEGVACIVHTHTHTHTFTQVIFNPLTSFLALCFYAHKVYKPKNWLYNACLDKTFPSSRNASPILMQLSLFYSPLNSCSDGSNDRSLQGKLPSSARFKSFIFISLPCLLLHPCENQTITWPSFHLQTYASRHLVLHVILHLMVYFLLRNK